MTVQPELDANGQGTFERVMKAIDLFEKYGVEYNILSVITNETVKKASYLYKCYKRNHFSYVQLIPCMDEPGRNRILDAEEYVKFLCEFFDYWYEDFCKGEGIDIRMFSNLIQMAAGFPAEECGMNGHCSCYFVVEGDGSVYPCDFYCLDEWKLGNVGEAFEKMAASKKAQEFVESSGELAAECGKCRYFSLCRGGCRRWREENGGPASLNYLCPAYKIFFSYAGERIESLGKSLKGY